MTLPAYGTVLKTRPEVDAPEQLVTMVEIGAVTEQRRGLAAQAGGVDKLKDPHAFFAMTYPSAEVRETLRALTTRHTRSDAPGVILLNGHFGLGKSHALLAAHHASTTPAAAKAWALDWSLPPYEAPEGLRVVTISLINQAHERLWEPVFQGLGRADLLSEVEDYADARLIGRALDEGPCVIIIDELERWFRAIDDERRQQQNLAFLQALSETASADTRLTFITSVLGESQEPAGVIQRIKPMEMQFASAEDRREVLLYRLFENRRDPDLASHIRTVAAAYQTAFTKAGLQGVDKYEARLREAWPFSAEFLDVMLDKVPRQGGFQNTRGTLQFLTHVVRATRDTRAMITSQDIPFRTPEVQTALASLDRGSGGEVVRRACNDNFDAVGDIPHKASLFSAILLYSIATPTDPGATEAEVYKAVLDPDENPMEIRDSLRQMKSTAFNLHRVGERYLFRADENPHARINAVAASLADEVGPQRQVLEEQLLAAWGNTSRTALLRDHKLDAAKHDLVQMGPGRPRFLISTTRLAPGQRLRAQNLDERRNLMLLIEPRIRKTAGDATYSLLSDEALLERARIIMACTRLLATTPDSDAQRIYQDTLAQSRRTIRDLIGQRYGTYVAWHRAGANTDADTVDDTWYQIETFDTFEHGAFEQMITRDFTSPVEVRFRIAETWHAYKHQRVRRLADQFDKTPGYPVPFAESWVPEAVRTLVAEGTLGLQDDHQTTLDAATVAQLPVDGILSCALTDPHTGGGTQELPDPVYTHPHVEVTWNDAAGGVDLAWAYPRPAEVLPGMAFETLVQRYTSEQPLPTGKRLPINLDRTHHANRARTPETEHFDGDGLQPGIHYYYFVFLVHRPPTGKPYVVLSQAHHIQAPGEGTSPPDEHELVITPKNSRTRLYEAAEAKLMTTLSADHRVRKVDFHLHNVRAPALRDLAPKLAKHDLEVQGEVVFTIRGSFDRTSAPKLVLDLPDLDNVLYGASFHLQPSEA